MKNKLIFSAALVLSLGLAGCGEDKAKEDPKEEETQQATAKKENVQKEEKKVDDNEVKDGPLTKAGQWTKDGESKVTLVKINDDNQTYDIGPIKLTIESVKLLQHTNVDTETAEDIKSVHGKDINGELNTIQIIYTVENTADTNIMFRAVDTLTTDTKAQIMGTSDFAHNNNEFFGKVAVEGLSVLPYFNGPLTEINSVNIFTGDVFDNDSPIKLSPSQKIEISF